MGMFISIKTSAGVPFLGTDQPFHDYSNDDSMWRDTDAELIKTNKR